ncbi:hypothetical protein BH10CHL1_BH10CHL1_31060 [soil metagenome]
MEQTTLSLRAAWESFYVIIGSSAAALTGLQFVVIVLGAEVNMLGGDATRAFGTPTIVYFCTALLISAILSAPWPTLSSAGIGLGICGAVGFVYALIVIRHARRQTDYVPVFEDWLWHGALPLLAYAALLTAAIFLLRRPVPALFVIGGTTLLLLFVGIHNAWDAVTYIAFKHPRQSKELEVQEQNCSEDDGSPDLSEA